MPNIQQVYTWELAGNETNTSYEMGKDKVHGCCSSLYIDWGLVHWARFHFLADFQRFIQYG